MALSFFWPLVLAGFSAAHPLGNFSISQYSAIRVGRDSIALRYIVDMAEIPAFQELQESGIAAAADDPDAQVYLAKTVEQLREGLVLEINGWRLPLHAESKQILFPPGAGGLPTLKIGVLYTANYPANGDSPQYVLTYSDGNFAGRAGWKEIVAISAPEVKLVNSSVPETDRSAELTDYPQDLLNSPPQRRGARVEFTLMGDVGPLAGGKASGTGFGIAYPVAATRGGDFGGDGQIQLPTSSAHPNQAGHGGNPVVVNEGRTAASARLSAPSQAGEGTQLQRNQQGTPRDSFTELVASPELDWSIVLIALAVAAGLGAFHALEPGHGKTLVAAYLVGSRGTMQHAMLLGLVVTAAHTAGVYMLGGVTLYASQYIVPERLYPWLGVLSGAMITILGMVLVVKRWRGKDAAHSHPHHHHGHAQYHDHAHAREVLDDRSDASIPVHSPGLHAHHSHHEHDHVNHSRDSRRAHYRDTESHNTSARELLTLGISGGIVPCPAALVVLLSAVAMNRVGFGLLLIVAFSAGLAAVLITIGILMVGARRYMSRFQGEGLWVTQWLPMASSAFIVVIGVGLAWKASRGAGLPFLPWI